VLQGREKTLGPEHASTFSTVNNLGLLYAGLGRFDEAEKMYRRALQGYEKVMGHEAVKTHIPALNTLHNLAMLCAKLGKKSASEELYLRTLYGTEAVFGRGSARYQNITAALDALRNRY
jgi:Tfp pilus assembly protein PilF